MYKLRLVNQIVSQNVSVHATQVLEFLPNFMNEGYLGYISTVQGGACHLWVNLVIDYKVYSPMSGIVRECGEMEGLIHHTLTWSDVE